MGDTVRKPWLPTTGCTATYLRTLNTRGLDVPQVRGRDELGRQILDFIPGTLAMYDAPLDLPVIRRVGGLIRLIHDASVGIPVPEDWDVLIPARTPNFPRR